ncbi:MAG: minor capsid protein [bacterium]|nr:minor capsid protein [bacterium]
MAKRNSEYWKERMEALEGSQYSKSEEYYKDVQKQFRAAEKGIQMDIKYWYQRLAVNNGISFSEAKSLLKKDELEEFHWKVEEYIKKGQENAVNKRWMKELENASARHHISYLETMKLQARHYVEVLSAQFEKGMTDFLHKSYEDTFYHTAYEIAKGTQVGSSLARMDTRRIDTIIKQPWAKDGKSFSDRIWQNKDKLVQNLHTELTQGIIRGTPPMQATENLAKIMKVSRSQAGRIVMTENAAISSRAQQDCFGELKIKQYEIVATLDSRTSKVCRDMDGKVFDQKDYQVGVTAPPFHPWCRTTTVPYFDDEFTEGEIRAARGKDGKIYYVPSDMTYKEWEKAFVNGGDKSGFREVKLIEKSENMGYTKKTEEELKTIADKVKASITEYASNASRWSGKINIDNSLLAKHILGQKEWNCDITLIDTVDEGVVWHEMLHSCSGSYYSESVYVENQYIEEASVEFLTQQICDKRGILHEPTYLDIVSVLKVVNDRFNYGSELEFAKELFNIPLPDRYEWLEDKIVDSLKTENASFEDFNEVLLFVRKLQGGEY